MLPPYDLVRGVVCGLVSQSSVGNCSKILLAIVSDIPIYDFKRKSLYSRETKAGPNSTWAIPMLHPYNLEQGVVRDLVSHTSVGNCSKTLISN